MIYCYPRYDGQVHRKGFYSNWDEVPAMSFVRWQQIAIELERIEAKILPLEKDLRLNSEAILINTYQVSDCDIKIKRSRAKIEFISKQLKALYEQRDDLTVDGIALFCDIPVHVLSNMKKVRQDESIEDLTDNHIESYVALLYSLCNTPLPNEEARSFYFQTESDSNIAELKAIYKKMPFINKFSKKGRELKRKINVAVSSKYMVKDIWEQTTYANKKMQEIANNIVRQMEKGDFSNLIMLVALLTVENHGDSKVLEKIRNSTNTKNYVEQYNSNFIKLHRKRLELFTKSKVPLSIATVIRVKNFFLCKRKKWLQHITKY